MKINFPMLLIAMAISGLIFLGFHTWGDSLLFSLGTTGVCLAMFACATAFIISGSPRGTVMMRTASWCFFLPTLLADILLASFGAAHVPFIMVNGLLVCGWAATVYWIYNSKQ